MAAVSDEAAPLYGPGNPVYDFGKGLIDYMRVQFDLTELVVVAIAELQEAGETERAERIRARFQQLVESLPQREPAEVDTTPLDPESPPPVDPRRRALHAIEALLSPKVLYARDDIDVDHRGWWDLSQEVRAIAQGALYELRDAERNRVVNPEENTEE